MTSNPSIAKAPRPIGLTDDALSLTPTTPVLPPFSPTISGAAARYGTADLPSCCKSRSTASSPKHRVHNTDLAASLPVTIPTTEAAESSAPYSHVARQEEEQQQQRAHASLGSAFVSENSKGSFAAATPSLISVSKCNVHDAVPVTPTTTAGAGRRMMTIAVRHARGNASSSLQEYAVLEDFATTTTIPVSPAPYLMQPAPSPTSSTRSRTSGRPPMMNPDLFMQNVAETPLIPFEHGHPNDAVLTTGDSFIAGYSSVPSPATTSARPPTTPAEPSRTNLIVYNIGTEVTEETLHEVFDGYGDVVSCAVMREIHTGASLGTAFVRFATNAEARRALDALNDRMKPIFFANCEKPLVVQWARKQHDDNPVGEARKKIMKLFVRNIPLDCTVEALEDVFGRYGCVRQVTLHKDTARVDDPALERLIAFVIYTEEGAAERAAAAVHNTKPFPSCNGIPVMIKLAESSQRRRFFRNADGATTSTANLPMAGVPGGFVTSQAPATAPISYPTMGGQRSCSAGGEGIGLCSTTLEGLPTHHPHVTPPSGMTPYGLPGSPVRHVAASIPTAMTAAASPSPPRLSVLATQLYDLPTLVGTLPLSCQVPVTRPSVPSMYAPPEAAVLMVDGSTTDNYGLNGPHMYSNLYTNNSTTYYPAAAAGLQRSAPYTRLSQCSPQQPQGGRGDGEDFGSTDSLTRMNTLSSGDYGAVMGGAVYARSHAATLREASLTGYGTDRTFVNSSKSTVTSRTESTHSSNGNAVHAAPTGLRAASSLSRSWFSTQDNNNNSSSTSISAHGTMMRGGYQLSVPGAQGSGGGDGDATGEVTGGVGLNAPPVGVSVRTRRRQSLPAPSLVPAVTSGSGSVGGERGLAVQYRSYPGKTHRGSASNGHAAATAAAGGSMTNTSTTMNGSSSESSSVAGNGYVMLPRKAAVLTDNSASSTGNTLYAISNGNTSTSSSGSMLLPAAVDVMAGAESASEASENWRRAVRTHMQLKRFGDADAMVPSPAAPPSVVTGNNAAEGQWQGQQEQQRQQQQQEGQVARMCTPVISAAHAIEVVPKASPPRSPAAGVNWRLASATTRYGAHSRPHIGNTIDGPHHGSSNASGGGGDGGSSSAATSPSASACRRYYNNPYCPGSPKLYC